MKTRYTEPPSRSWARKGAVLPFFALLLPVLLILCSFAINLAYMQLRSTEVKIAADASAHAAGRAMSIRQSTDAAFNLAESTLGYNLATAATGYSIGEPGSGSDIEIGFGTTSRAGSSVGRHVFSEVSRSAVDSGRERASSVSVQLAMDFDHIFPFLNRNDFVVSRRSIATQVDRDIALVLDRSGSMLWYQDENALKDALLKLYRTIETSEGYWKYRYWRWHRGRWRSVGYHRTATDPGWRILNPNDRRWVRGRRKRLISRTEYQNATKFLYYRSYSNNVIYQLERLSNNGHELGNSYSRNERFKLVDQMACYCHDWQYEKHRAPDFSRWYYLDLGVHAFLKVLEGTDQQERVSLTTFASSARLDLSLQDRYYDIEAQVKDIRPYGGTAIGSGMNTGLPSIITGRNARPFAAKTIVVLTDGDSNTGVHPVTAAKNIVAENDVVIHTVTFSRQANKTEMQRVAAHGNGRHYHADEGEDLINVFREIANNLPTVLTE